MDRSYNNDNHSQARNTRTHKPNDAVGETTVEGRVIPVGRDGEAIVFEVDFGIFKIICIANIPGDGKDKAPVYVKFKMNRGFERTPTRVPAGFRRGLNTGNSNNVHNDGNSIEDEGPEVDGNSISYPAST